MDEGCPWEDEAARREVKKGLLGLECGWSEPLPNLVAKPPRSSWTVPLATFDIPHEATCRATS
ncbi:hypothetical protein U0070_013191 [Myodes glareolus]|uniref:Uncharacterized protein n=1 Tax=Myodes glareolus TaxID=447135 RepID=A0AAW0HHU6_MYOGA